MNAKDIMTRDIITVSPNMNVKNLAMALIKNQISGAPVAGKNGKVVGVVSEADIVVANMGITHLLLGWYGPFAGTSKPARVARHREAARPEERSRLADVEVARAAPTSRMSGA